MLKRYPERKNETLQAWDSADELLLQWVREQVLPGKKILIIQDSFGALTVGLKDHAVTTTYTDSFSSQQGILRNSGGEVLAKSLLSEVAGPAFAGAYDLVLIKLPNNTSFFEDILAHLSQCLSLGTPVVCGGMVKYLSKSYFDLLQKYIGETTTSLAQKKARLVFSQFARAPVPSPYPLTVPIETFAAPFIHHSNLFSREKLDIGTRFFLQHLPTGRFSTILDLGCGNGIVGIRAKMLNPEARILFSDDSRMAVESARLNYERQIGPFMDGAEAIWVNCYEVQSPASLDLVLCNPPFHQQNAVGDSVAWQMFHDSREALQQGGVIRVIGNSHLGYEAKLKKLFGNATRIASNQKFSIVEAQKR